MWTGPCCFWTLLEMFERMKVYLVTLCENVFALALLVVLCENFFVNLSINQKKKKAYCNYPFRDKKKRIKTHLINLLGWGGGGTNLQLGRFVPSLHTHTYIYQKKKFFLNCFAQSVVERHWETFPRQRGPTSWAPVWGDFLALLANTNAAVHVFWRSHHE